MNRHRWMRCWAWAVKRRGSGSAKDRMLAALILGEVLAWMGMVAGASNAYGKCGAGFMSEEERMRLSGNAFDADAMWALCVQWEVKQQVPVVLAVADLECLGPKEQLSAFGDLYRRGRLEEWFENKARTLRMIELDVEAMLMGSQSDMYQTPAPGLSVFSKSLRQPCM